MEYRGAIYGGEHPAIVDLELWGKVNADFRTRQRRRSHAVRAKQNALLTGLLFCKSCQRPMIATYTSNGGRRFRYYVCQRARQNGWSACPTKSVPAATIEESVVSRLRAALSSPETRQQLHLDDCDCLVLLEDEPGGLVRALVEHILYDGKTGAVVLTLKTSDSGNYEN